MGYDREAKRGAPEARQPPGFAVGWVALSADRGKPGRWGGCSGEEWTSWSYFRSQGHQLIFLRQSQPPLGGSQRPPPHPGPPRPAADSPAGGMTAPRAPAPSPCHRPHGFKDGETAVQGENKPAAGAELESERGLPDSTEHPRRAPPGTAGHRRAAAAVSPEPGKGVAEEAGWPRGTLDLGVYRSPCPPLLGGN